jgi:hypothetical protein
MVEILLEETEKFVPEEEKQDVRFSTGWRENILDMFKLCEYCAS